MRKTFDNIDDFLGEKSTRFFSNGYKRAIRAIQNIVITSSGAEATCQVYMPADWSVKGVSRQIAHLSSVDAVLIALQLSEAYCVDTYALTSSMRQKITIASFSVKAGEEPLEELENFKSTTTLSSVKGDLLSFVCRVGSMTLDLTLQLPFAYNNSAEYLKEERRYESISNILGEPTGNFYGTGFSDVTHHIKNVEIDLEASVVTANIDGVFPSRKFYQGIETERDDSASSIDAMVILSQLIQCYLYLLDGISRANSSTLWMRAMTFSAIDSTSNDASFASITVERSERILVEDVPWRCVNVRGQLGGMAIFYSLGHALPY